jgi:hypothetical protein
MKKLITKILIIFCIINFGNLTYAINIKSFKSKDGYSITYPREYSITESQYGEGHMVIIADPKKADGGKNLMFIITAPKIFNSDFPYPTEIRLGDPLCNELENIYSNQISQKVTLEVCQKTTLFKNGIKTVYNSMYPEYKQYQYSIEINDKTFLISGTCKIKNCLERDRELSSLALSIK